MVVKTPEEDLESSNFFNASFRCYRTTKIIRQTFYRLHDIIQHIYSLLLYV
ncbi:GSCOCG00010154001-RA-CDS [Cotesia congregata]|nr:GSCOCG00010154001-RA-CDS [Cotesia congregata]